MPRREGVFPDWTLPDVDGALSPLARAWAAGPALVLIGHRTCKTTRETLPWLDRLHRRRGANASVVAVLQDDAETARELIAAQGLQVPVRLEADPYPLAAALDITTVPTLFAIGRDGTITAVSEGLRRADLEALGRHVGVTGELFTPEDKVPAGKPG
jgi:peroxiredoxin